jgi:hypothetical protein
MINNFLKARTRTISSNFNTVCIYLRNPHSTVHSYPTFPASSSLPSPTGISRPEVVLVLPYATPAPENRVLTLSTAPVSLRLDSFAVCIEFRQDFSVVEGSIEREIEWRRGLGKGRTRITTPTEPLPCLIGIQFQFPFCLFRCFFMFIHFMVVGGRGRGRGRHFNLFLVNCLGNKRSCDRRIIDGKGKRDRIWDGFIMGFVMGFGL